MPISHEQWDALLKKHVRAGGLVNYSGFIADSLALNKYLEHLSENYPDAEIWSKNEQLAYWINAYNAFTVRIVIRNYPLESIKDISPAVSVPFVNSVWDLPFITTSHGKLSLNDIEHRILRKKFDEPRIHFAINCASISCPDLIAEAYTAEKLEEQLKAQATAFLNDSTKNRVREHELELSKIFSWFKGDFTQQGSLQLFIEKHAGVPVDPDAKVRFMDYNWALNQAND